MVEVWIGGEGSPCQVGRYERVVTLGVSALPRLCDGTAWVARRVDTGD